MKLFVSWIILSICFFGDILTKENPCQFTPNFFGTLLELSSANVEQGTVSLQTYFYGGYVYGNYQNNFSLDRTLQYGFLNPQINAYAGLTSSVELDFITGMQTVFFQGKNDTSMNDTTLGLAYQPLFNDQHSNIPNLRFVFYEIFPTSAHDQATPDLIGINTSGAGSYGTEVGFTINKNFYTFPCHPYSLSLNFTYTYRYLTRYKGINFFGGGPFTDIRLRPGGIFWSDLGFEIALNTHIFFALDLQYTHILKAHYNGYVGYNFDGSLATVSTNSKDLFVVAPAFEFSVNPNFSCYLGGYFTAFGRNTSAEALGVFALAYSF
jgi:hypothetical protein